MPNTFAPDHKTYYSNIVTMQVNENDSFVSFGQSAEDDPTSATRCATIYMTHKSLKVLREILTLVITNFETQQGREIVLPDGYVDKLKEVFSLKPSSTDLPPPA